MDWKIAPRLRESQVIALIFDNIASVAQEKGFIGRRTKQLVDATHIIFHVNRISTTDLLFRTVKCLVEEIEEKDAECYEREHHERILGAVQQPLCSRFYYGADPVCLESQECRPPGSTAR